LRDGLSDLFGGTPCGLDHRHHSGRAARSHRPTLKLNQQTIRNWIDAGSLPALRVGRRVRVLRRDLDQLLAEAEASATSASQPGADAGQDGVGCPDAQAFWGGP
jgi:excisionase family DNA binding protein